MVIRTNSTPPCTAGFMTTQELGENEVDIWCGEVPGSREISLSSREKRSYLASGKLIPQILSSYRQFEKGELAFLDSGKPVVNFPSQASTGSPADVLYCSASHSADIGVYTLSLSGGIGIDIEKMRQRRSMEGIYINYFHPEEQLELEGLHGNVKTERFFQLWTLKEALGKVTGKGISGDFRNFSFRSLNLEAVGRWQTIDALPGFFFWSQKFNADYWLSVAISVDEFGNHKESNSKFNGNEYSTNEIRGYNPIVNFIELDYAGLAA